MPDVVTDDRLALDETSLNFRGLDAATLERCLDALSETLSCLRQRGLTVRVHPWLWDSVECLDGCVICDFVYQPGVSPVSPDSTRLLAMLLDRCPAWDEETPSFAVSLESVDITPAHGSPPADQPPVRLDPSFSVGIAISRASTRAMACLVFGACTRRGFWSVVGTPDTARTYFFAEEGELAAFWRDLYADEAVDEAGFFSLARHAFPDLVLHPSLSFGRFDGRYRDVRDSVVQVLGVLNDHFARVMVDRSGIPHQVAAALGQYGVEVSPESSNTRSSPRLMAMRDVTVDGNVYRCEWHAKLEPTRNRIHFSLPVPELAGRIVVGAFVDHLPT